MHPLQLAAIVALVVSAAIYVWRGVTRDMRTIEQFFRGLVQRLSQVLEPKGFRLTRHVYMRQSFGHRIATFQGANFQVDAAWEGRDREILLLQRALDEGNVSAGRILARAHLPQGTLSAAFVEASNVIVTAANAIEGAAYKR